MYSPKIREDLIPRIYQSALAAKVFMTTWVNQAVEHALSEKAQSTPLALREGAHDSTVEAGGSNE